MNCKIEPDQITRTIYITTHKNKNDGSEDVVRIANLERKINKLLERLNE